MTNLFNELVANKAALMLAFGWAVHCIGLAVSKWASAGGWVVVQFDS